MTVITRKSVKVLGVLMFGSMLAALGGCTKGVTASGKHVLAGAPLDALDMVIVVESSNTAREWNHTLTLSPDLQAKISKYNGKVRFSINAKGVTAPLLADGAKVLVSKGDEFCGTLKGALNDKVCIIDGGVGVIKGRIFVAEGTEANIDGKEYKYRQGQWLEAKAAKK